MIFLSVIAIAADLCAADVTVTVKAEETIYTFESPNNGSGPLWSYGCTPIVRLGDEVVVSQMETGKDVPPLANTRWRLLRRMPDGWKLIAEEDGYRQREPCVLATVSNDAFYLNVNDSQTPPGTKYGLCKPQLLRFTLADPATRQVIDPKWQGEPNYTDHSYRGFAADRERGELLMLNIDAKSSVENWCLMTAPGETVRNGGITFPIRSCYPQVALQRGAAYVLAIGDIREPIEAWEKYKKEKTGQEWDYVFRILHFTSTPDLVSKDFAPPIEVANVDATAGYIGNQDLWIAPDGSALVMYTQCEVQSALLRDKFFPGKSILSSLHLATIKDNAITSRRVLVAGTDTGQPACARFHQMPDGTVYALACINGPNLRNVLMQIYPAVDNPKQIPVPFKTPFTSFLLATVRAGNTPNKIIDILGNTTSGTTICYGQVAVE